MADDGICHVCNEYIHNLTHNSSVNHRFNFFKWSYNRYRKALIRERHGVNLEVELEKIPNLNLKYNGGKYKIQVSSEQLQHHNNTITFKCKIKNVRKDPIYITSTVLPHSSDYFSIIHPNDFGRDELTVIKLQSGCSYLFRVVFKTEILTNASYKIPLFCNFQTVDNKQDFTIVRAFLLIVDDQIKKMETKLKSPFTSRHWTDVIKTVSSSKIINNEDKWLIPEKRREILIHGLRRFKGMTINDENNLMELTQLLQTLTKNNYNTYWHNCLWWEERVLEEMLMKYNMERICVQVREYDIIEIEIPGLAEKRPSVIVGDFIKIRISGDHTAYMGFVNKVNDRTVEISHVNDEIVEILESNPSYEVDVSFMLGRVAFERMHNGVENLAVNYMVDQLFPLRISSVKHNTVYQLRDTDFFNRTILGNNEQKNAVNKILNSTINVPYIVFGPPGTGKTITIVEAILQIKKRTKKTILVCAPSNSACDMLALKLIPCCTHNELLRIHSTTRERTTITAELVEYSNMIEDEVVAVHIEKIRSYRIIVTTLVLIGKFAKVNYQPDCIFIDEAAQASEPETVIALSLGGVTKQIVLAGDPKQLGPIAVGCPALGVSLLERLMEYDIYKLRKDGNYDSDFITMLKLNFRSHPDILVIPNELFYDNLLKPMARAPKSDPIVDLAIYPMTQRAKNLVKGRAVEFCSVSAKDHKEGLSPSYYNSLEVQVVVKYVQLLLKLNLGDAYKVREDQIGIVTPYKRQVYKILEELGRAGCVGVEVGTTECFQGREKRIVIISTVRAQHSQLLPNRKYNLGFVGNYRRFNVALTRAISKLIVIGCPLVLRTDEKWEKYMNLCEGLETYFGNSFQKDNDQFREDVLERVKHFTHQDQQYNH